MNAAGSPPPSHTARSGAPRAERGARHERPNATPRQAQDFERALAQRHGREEDAGGDAAASPGAMPPALPWRWSAALDARPGDAADAVAALQADAGGAAHGGVTDTAPAAAHGPADASATERLLQRQLQGSGEAASFAGSAALQALTAAAEPRSVELSIDMPLGQTLQVQATQALHEAQAGTHAAQGAPWRLALTATGAEAERLVRQVPQLESRLRARGLLEGSVDLVAREGRQERGEGGEQEA